MTTLKQTVEAQFEAGSGKSLSIRLTEEDAAKLMQLLEDTENEPRKTEVIQTQSAGLQQEIEVTEDIGDSI